MRTSKGVEVQVSSDSSCTSRFINELHLEHTSAPEAFWSLRSEGGPQVKCPDGLMEFCSEIICK